jgi:hypothetical protein
MNYKKLLVLFFFTFNSGDCRPLENPCSQFSIKGWGGIGASNNLGFPTQFHKYR